MKERENGEGGGIDRLCLPVERPWLSTKKLLRPLEAGGDRVNLVLGGAGNKHQGIPGTSGKNSVSPVAPGGGGRGAVELTRIAAFY